MASIDAKNVAYEVLETIGKEKKVVLGNIIKKHGYSKVTAKVPSTVTNTKSYQDVINPVIDQMIEERERAIKALKGKISKAKYRDLIDATDKLTKNIQLLNGGETERQGISIGFHQSFKKL